MTNPSSCTIALAPVSAWLSGSSYWKPTLPAGCICILMIAQQKLDAAQLLARPDADTHLYVCGPGGFMEHVLSTARQQGWPESQLHREYFAAAPVNHDADGSFEVELQSSGVVYQIPAERSIVQVLEAAGVDVPVSCEQGICGTCLTRVLSGEPDHRDMFMTDEEHAANDQMTLCCSRSRSARLVLDL